MRIFCQHKSIYTLNKLLKQQVFTDNQKADPRYKVIHDWEILRKEGVSLITCQKVLKISRATYYRYKKAIKEGL